uniref:Cadherin-23 n=2 Tax=Culex pipiens TaxID=7175 RepID=A0A8D8D154_CULPI
MELTFSLNLTSFLLSIILLVACKQRATSYKFMKVRLKILLGLLLILLPTASCNRPPRFLIDGPPEIVLRLKEGSDTPVDSLIYRVKGYDPDGDPLTFGVRPSVDSDLIRLEQKSKIEANIYLSKELDREVKNEYKFVLTLSDGRLGDYTITQSLLLLVEDVNDNEPIFKPFTSAVEVSENSAPGVIVTVEATDRDEGAYGQVVYFLEELEGDNEVFTISTTYGKGIIRLVGSLDYERKSLYQLRILAKDRAIQGRVNTGTAALLVKVKDVEDQLPEFILVSSVTRIAEDAPVGTEVTAVKAIDGDRGVNNRIQYSIVENDGSPFSIDRQTGAIVTTAKLDREDTRNRMRAAYILEIVATEVCDVEPAPLVKTELTILITDVNDESPTFKSHKYELEINENAQQNTPVTFLSIGLNFVFDYDQGKNGTFDLYLEPGGGAFEISPSRAVNEATFILRVANPSLLDYEKNKTMNFKIHAREITDEGRHNVADIVVYIRDQNDNFPEYEKAQYECYLPENSVIGVILTQVQAVDIDSGRFGTEGIRYTHISGSMADLLSLHPVTGAITLKIQGDEALDRELIQKHYLTVEARDDFGKGNLKTVQVIVFILDSNDNFPVFLQNSYEARLMENKMSFETPLIIHAKDADQNGTRNSEVRYEIIEGQFKENFTIDYVNGELKPKTYIDFELLDSGIFNIRPIHLTVQASDLGTPSLSSKVSVIVYVQDVNDHPPQFTNLFYSRSIPEDLPGGSSVLSLNAIDMDGSSPNNFIVYRIQSGASDKFVISPDKGIISIATGATLDPDLTESKITEYALTVVALDGGIGEQQLRSYCKVNIAIIDKNNKVPYFLEPGTISIRENSPVGTYAYRLIAYDLDRNPMLRFYMDGNNSEARSEDGLLVKLSEYDYLAAFSLNSTDGLIRVVKLLDREKIETVRLGFIVEDVASESGKQTSSATLVIRIEDENDNSPRFQKSFYKRSVAENSPIGSPVLNVFANDIDKNKTIRYTLEGPKEITRLLHLDTESGEIVIANKIDYEIFQWLNVTVRATDSGYPSRSSLTELIIRVIDENDNNPYFSSDATNFTVYENSPIGFKIASLQAQDADTGSFGKITYLIDRMSSNGKFSIDPESGDLLVADYLDREAKQMYMLVIEAWDNYQFGYLSGESRNAFKQIFVSILDENDNTPVMTVPEGCAQVTEFHNIREPLMEIKATDIDDSETGNAQIEFEIVETIGTNIFYLKQIASGKAEIYSNQSLNNLYGNYSLLITARDKGVPSNAVSEKVDICVLDFNDHAPNFIFPSNDSIIHVPENATVGTSIIQVKAIDSDIGPNAAVMYRFKPDPVGGYRSFSIDEYSGVITLKLLLDRERQKKYELRVEAYDQGIPTPLSADLDLSIHVKNVNDYEPKFLIEEITVNFTEHSKPGMEYKKLPDTIDRDEVDYFDDTPTLVCYFIVHGNEEGHFQLDKRSHILTVVRELDREKKSNHTLIVKASENCINTPENLALSQPRAIAVKSSENDVYQIASQTHFVSVQNFETNQTVKNVQQMQLNEYHSSKAVAEKYSSDFFYQRESTLVRVLIYVQDINDNPPVFTQKIFTGGVTTSTTFGTQFMKLTVNHLLPMT